MKFQKVLVLVLLTLLLAGCSEDEDVPSGSDGLLFSIDGKMGDINEEHDVIFLGVPRGTDVTKLTPQLKVSYGATVSPASGVQQDFSKPVIYTVTKSDGGTREFVVIVQEEIKKGTPRLVANLQTLVHNKVVDKFMFEYDQANRLTLFTYVDIEANDTDITNIVYDAEGKVSQLILEKKENGVVKSNGIMNVAYIDNNTIHLTQEIEGEENKFDIITLDGKGRLVKYEQVKEENVMQFEYDANGNGVKVIYGDGSYEVDAYDDKNGFFHSFITDGTPQWMFIYTTTIGGVGRNNILSIEYYTKEGEFELAYKFDLFYNAVSDYVNAIVFYGGEDKVVSVPYYISR